jgi:anti-anti-sigma regulatory factor
MGAVTLMTLKITETEKAKNKKFFRLEGKLTHGDAEVFGQTFEQNDGDGETVLDLSGVTFVDSDGASVLTALRKKGVELIGLDFFIKAIIEAHNDSNK